MSLKKRATLSLKKFNAGINYKVVGDKLADAQNVYNNKDVTETRFGIARYNTTTLSGTVLSTSFFKSDAGNRYLLAKVGTILYRVNASGAATVIKTGLSVTTKHRGITLDSRHIIAVESDGLFSYNGTTFTQLGQDPPSSVTVAIAAGGSLTTNNDYQVAITYYASTIGFESNAAFSSVISTTANLKINLSDIPSTADNALIDQVRIYLKDVEGAGEYELIDTINLGTTTYSITAESGSIIQPPTTNAEPSAGGGKYLTSFGKKIAYAGNSTYKSDVFISEDFLADAFDDTQTSRTLSIEGQGPITGIACGTFSDSNLDPYLVIFKKSSTTIYSDIGGNSRQSLLDSNIGCISHETIKVVNGVIYFMSENGWYMINNGIIVKDEKNNPAPLAGGDIDDIFSRSGWEKELNKALYSSFFSVVYPTHRQYWTFVSEGSGLSFNKAYVYERDINGFRVFTFGTSFTSACEGEDDSGNVVVFMSDSSGIIFTYSIENELHDVDFAGTSALISSFVILPFFIENDLYSTYNYRFLTLRALASTNDITCKVFSNFLSAETSSTAYDFTDPTDGFILDTDALDVGILGSERVVVTTTADINVCAETIMIGFYQDILDANIGLISAQLQYNKNGNANR